MKERLKEMLNEERYQHTLGVAQTAFEIAQLHGVDSEKAYTAGMLHDVAKCISKQEMLDVCIKNAIEIDEAEKNSPQLLHAPAGVALAKNEFGITDEEILSAIRYHTTARPNMTNFEKILYIADCIEPNRKYGDLENMRKLAKIDLDECFLMCIDSTIRFVMEKRKLIHINSVLARNCVITHMRNR